VPGELYWYDTPLTWRVFPWAVVGTLILLSALLTIVFTGMINDSYPYVQWPWLYSYQMSLLYAFLVQETLIVVIGARSQFNAANEDRRRATEAEHMHDTTKSYTVDPNLKRVMVPPPDLVPRTPRGTAAGALSDSVQASPAHRLVTSRIRVPADAVSVSPVSPVKTAPPAPAADSSDNLDLDRADSISHRFNSIMAT